MDTSRPAVLVTGGAKRLGGAIAQKFGEAGWHVIIHYHSSSDDAQELADTLPSSEIIQCDLADGDAAVRMVHDLSARTGNWQCLVNCASVFEYDDMRALDPALSHNAIQVNAITPARMAQAYLSAARTTSGACVINVTDMKIENTNPDFFSYTMSKNALHSAIGMLSKGRSNSADRIYGLAPGAILASHDQSEGETDISHKLNLLGRKTGADEIADAALFLAGRNLASGQTVFVDSGQHLLDQDRDVIYLARDRAMEG
ncbi:SDR family oxidoreductase [Erythrobacter sp. W53]|uniref:SDR family oxidoreductase n=1 Tax=Erythrobacter sp. W53 TaxID=3425947 RepID=UPI003D767455